MPKLGYLLLISSGIIGYFIFENALGAHLSLIIKFLAVDKHKK